MRVVCSVRFIVPFLLCVPCTVHPEGQPPRHPPGHVVVRFKNPKAPPQLTRSETLAWLLDKLELASGARLTETQFAMWQSQEALGSIAPVWERALYLHLPPGLSVGECVRQLQEHPAVDYVEPDWTIQGALIAPNDPGYAMQWHHRNTISNGTVRADIHSPEAWTITRGSSNVLVALLDSGLNAALPDFAGRVVPGYNFVSGNTNTMDDHFHGTAIASLLGATGNNGAGVVGVDWECRLMPIKVLNSQDRGQASWYADGLDWARVHGCKVVNMSFAEAGPSETVYRAITNAIAAGLVLVALMDNGGWPNATFPGNVTNIITVGSTDRRDRWSVSNYGPEIDLVAPGADITFLALDGSVTSGSGNSASAPLVSGVASLLAAVRPDLTPAMAWTFLAAGADDVLGDPLDTPGFDLHYGWGRVNAFNSLVLARSAIENVAFEENITLRWQCPANAIRRRPYEIEEAQSPEGPWTPVTGAAPIVYQGMRASWTDERPAGAPARFYRLRVVVR